jgi:hypothetical protein
MNHIEDVSDAPHVAGTIVGIAVIRASPVLVELCHGRNGNTSLREFRQSTH